MRAAVSGVQKADVPPPSATKSPELPSLLDQAVPGALLEAATARDELTLVVARDRLLDALRFLRKEERTAFDFITDITAVDRLPGEPRFEVVYHLCSIARNDRVRVKVRVSGDAPSVPSVCSVWEGANWLEREVYDMFGISFEGHPGLQRILMPDEWAGHPLRKDYPLGGEDVQFESVPPTRGEQWPEVER